MEISNIIYLFVDHINSLLIKVLNNKFENLFLIQQTGRIDISTPKVSGHSGPVYDIKWCPYNDNLIASASDDCTIKLWHIPDGGLKANLCDPLVDLRGHQRRVTHIEWHPTAENVLFSAACDYLVSRFTFHCSAYLKIIGRIY